MAARGSTTAAADLSMLGQRGVDGPGAAGNTLARSLGRLRASDDPVVTFAGLAKACVPEFADGCDVELCAGTEPVFRASQPTGPADGRERQAARHIASDQMLITPFRVVSRTGYPSYSGLVTHWWTDRTPSESDAVIADLMVTQLAALVELERLSAEVARAEDRAASIAQESIRSRTINIATGIVMHQKRLPQDDAERLLRHAARTAGTSLAHAASAAVRGGALRDSGAQADLAASRTRLSAVE